MIDGMMIFSSLNDSMIYMLVFIMRTIHQIILECTILCYAKLGCCAINILYYVMLYYMMLYYTLLQCIGEVDDSLETEHHLVKVSPSELSANIDASKSKINWDFE